MIRLYVVCYSAKKNETKLCYKQATAWMNLKSRKLSEGSQRTEDAEGNMGHTVAKRFPGLGSWGGSGGGVATHA